MLIRSPDSLQSFVMAHSFMRLARRSRFDDVGIGGRDCSARPSTRVSPSDKTIAEGSTPLPLLRVERRTAASAIGGPFGVQAIGGGTTLAGDGIVCANTHVVFYRAGAIEKHSAPTRLHGQARRWPVSRSSRHSNPLSSLARVWRLVRIGARKRRGWTAT